MNRMHLLPRLGLLLASAGAVAVVANSACLPDVCADQKSADFKTTADLAAVQIQSLASTSDRNPETASRNLFSDATLTRPVKLPDGSVHLPAGWLPPLPAGHPWNAVLTPADDAFYSRFEERVLKAGLYDPQNPEHAAAAAAYLAKANSASPQFSALTYANRTSCSKKNAAPDSAAGGYPFQVN